MGNALRFLYGKCCNPQPEGSIGPHGVPHATVGFSALSRDLFQFEATGQVLLKVSLIFFVAENGYGILVI